MTGPKQGGDGFGFYKELAYGDSKEVFIPSYDPTFLAEVLEDLMAFKKFVVHDGHMLRQYNDLIRFFGSLQNEILPLKNDNYVVKFPADVIFQVQNYWYRILPGECGILDNPKNMTAVQKVFYVYWVAIAISLSAVINSCGYISGTGLLGYANAHRPFQSNIFDDINDSKNPVDIELKSHAIYLVRLISFFTMRRNICFENIHFKQPYPDFLLQGNNRFKSRVLSCIEEDCVTNFKTHYFTPKNFPSLSYNSSFNQGKMPLFDHYQVLFKENNPPKNTRINSIIHNESLSTPIPFHAMKISENGLLERDFNPRLSSYLSTRDYGKNFDQDLYLERHLTELLQDRRLLHSVTLYDSNNNVDPTAYLAILNDIAKDDENGVNEFDAQVLADNIAAKNRDFLQLINYS